MAPGPGASRNSSTNTNSSDPSNPPSTTTTTTSTSEYSLCTSTTTEDPEPVLDPFAPVDVVTEDITQEEYDRDYEKLKAAAAEALKKLPADTQELIRKGEVEILVQTNLYAERLEKDGESWKKEDADNHIEPTEGRKQNCNEEEMIVRELDDTHKDVGDAYKRGAVPVWEHVYRADCENSQWYPEGGNQEEKPKNLIQRLVALESPETVTRFIRHFERQQEATAEFMEDDPTKETVYTTVAPSDRSVLYMAVDFQQNSFYLTPIHLEVVGGRRPSLHYLTLNSTSYDVASKKMFRLDEISIGDIFYVDVIVPNPTVKSKPMLTDMAGVGDPNNHKFWKIQCAARIPRTVAKEKLAHHWVPKDSNKLDVYLVEDQVSPAVMTHTLVAPKKHKREEWLEVTVMTPPVQPGRNLRGFNPGGQEEDALNLFRPHCPLWSVGPRIITAKPLEGKNLKLVQEGVMQFKEDGQLRNRSFQQAARLIRFGAYAQMAMVNFRHDPRSYVGRVSSGNVSPFGHTLDIDVENPTVYPMQTTQWRTGTMVTVKRNQVIIPGRVTSVTMYRDGRCTVIVRLAKRVKVDLSFYLNKQIFIQHKVQDPEEQLRQQIGKMHPPDYSTKMTAMRIWAATLGASKIVDPEERRVERPYRQGKFVSTKQQGKVLDLMDDPRIPGAIVHCAFGAGKTTTLVTTLLHHSESWPNQWLAYTAQSNMAIVQAVRTWEKWDPKKKVKAVRMMSAANRDRLDQTQHTIIDFPVLLWQALQADFQMFNFPGVRHSSLHTSITRHLVAHQRVFIRDIVSKDLREACRPSYRKQPPEHSLHECFIRVYRPTIFFGTTTSLRQTFSNNDFMHEMKDKINTICVDEASQLPRASFTALVCTFPRARMFLTGDSKQLPPYEETNTPKKLASYSGAWFQQAYDNKVLPIVSISVVYRCPPYATKWLSESFYNKTLSSPGPLEYQGTELQRLGFPHRAPLQFINTNSEESRDGTSARNLKEALICAKIIQKLTEKVAYKDVVVVCFYLAQVSLVTGILPRGIHVTTVDGVQGAEYEYVVVCTTRSIDFTKSMFINSKERTNVALSRAKKATIVLLNLKATHNAVDCWDKVIRRVPAEARFPSAQLPWMEPSEHEIAVLDNNLRASEFVDQVADRVAPSPRR
ncbi:unnamed protein product [Caenorhabditis brenneri]